MKLKTQKKENIIVIGRPVRTTLRMEYSSQASKETCPPREIQWSIHLKRQTKGRTKNKENILRKKNKTRETTNRAAHTNNAAGAIVSNIRRVGVKFVSINVDGMVAVVFKDHTGTV